jgi:hypothetical protein
MHLPVQEAISYLFLHSISVADCREINLGFSSERGHIIIFNSNVITTFTKTPHEA